MFLNIKQVPATSALITAPCILAATFRALTSFLLLTFINICVWNKNREGGERERGYTKIAREECETGLLLIFSSVSVLIVLK